MNALVFASGGGVFSLQALLLLLVPADEYRSLFVRLCLSLEISSLLYRTTSLGSFSDGFSAIERALTRREETPVADLLSLTITFIPRLLLFWQRIDLAWKARGGTPSVRRIVVLTPLLFRLGMHEAWQKALTRENRRP